MHVELRQESEVGQVKMSANCAGKRQWETLGRSNCVSNKMLEIAGEGSLRMQADTFQGAPWTLRIISRRASSRQGPTRTTLPCQLG